MNVRSFAIVASLVAAVTIGIQGNKITKIKK